MFRPTIALFILCVSSFSLAGCGDPPAGKTKATDAKATPKKTAQTSQKKASEKSELVVYSGRSAKHVEPLLKQFEKETGITVKTRFDKSTQTLANRIASEGQQTEADIFFAQDSGYLGALARAGLLAPLPKKLIESVPLQFRHKDGLWTGTSGRARVLVYNPERVKPEDLPKSLAELTDLSGRVAWAGRHQMPVSRLTSAR